MDGRRDTIAAIATPSGIGGVGIIRLSGPAAIDIVAALVGRSSGQLEDRRLIHAVARDLEGGRLDDVLAVAMRAPRSVTGEDVAEIHGHGGAANLGRLLRAVIARGARPAEAGEFTRRAFEHDRIDLTRAEALAGVIEASGERSLRLAQAQLGGALGDALDDLRARGTALLAEVEAGIDFPEEGLELDATTRHEALASELAARCEALADGFARGRAIREGIDVALVGAVNVGKSSLFNALLGRERAVVAAEPGTTRDFVEASAMWEGVRVTLIDTAGARTSEREVGAVEQRGFELGVERARSADLRVIVVDGTSSDGSVPSGEARTLIVMSKVDARGEERRVPPGVLATSAVRGDGIEELRRAIVRGVVGDEGEGDDGVLVTTERQRSGLVGAAAGFGAAAAGMRAGSPGELIAVHLRDGTGALAALRGERVGDEVLDELFRRFCIGK